MLRLPMLLLAFFLAGMAAAQSKIYYVSPTGTGDGSSWDKATTLIQALNNAVADDQIWVRGFETVTKDELYIVPKEVLQEGFTVKSGVQLYGGFAGTETKLTDRETLGKPYQLKYRSVLSGDIGKDDAMDDVNLIFPANTTRQNNATHVLTLNMAPQPSGNNNTYPTVVNGFTITGGQADENGEKGGGIYVTGSNEGGGNFRIERCFLFNNYATQGGAVYVSSKVKNRNNGESLINQCVIYNNAAGERAAVENQGGGVYLDGAATVVNTSIFNNENGGVRLSSGSKVVNATIARNTGAGVDLTTASNSTSVYNSIIWGNTSLSAEHQPTFKHSAYHEVTADDENSNVYVAKENRDAAAGPMFDAPSVKTSYDRDFDWLQSAYPLWSWNVLEGSVMIDKGDNAAYQTSVYRDEDMAGHNRISGTNISIGAYEYQYLPTSRIRYVKPTATGTGDGSSWANASGDLQKMIDELAESTPSQTGEVWVAAGTYTPQSQLISGTAYSASFRMRDGISVYGGFAGTESSKLDRPQKEGAMPWDFTNPTILEAAYYNHGDLAWTNNKWTLTSDSRHVVWFAPMSGGTAFANVTTLDGVTIQGGYAQGGTGQDDFLTDRGGGVYMDGANAYLSNCIVRENYATGNGGGVYLKNGRVQTSLIYNNNADADGGAVYVENRGLVHRSMLTNNSALNGAGVYLYNGAEAGSDDNYHPEYLILSTCVVSNNTVRGNGAVYCDKGGVLMQNTITNNECVTATDATDVNASQTGGIYVNEYALVLNSVLWNNQMHGGTNIPMYARNPSAAKVRFLYNAISGVNNAVWNNTLQEQTLSLVDENAGKQDDGTSIGPRFTEPTELNISGFDLEDNYGVQDEWKDGLISYYWKPVSGSNLWARGMALGQLPSEVVLSPELDIEGKVYAQKPAVGAFMVEATSIQYADVNDSLTVYVDVDCTEPEHQGNSWATAYRSLNDAISYLAGLDQNTVGQKHLVVRVLEGDIWPRYAFTNNDPKTATISVPKTVSGQPIEIYGGYHRTTDNNTVIRDPLTYRSIINGNTEAKDITQGLYHCITVGEGAQVVLDGFHVINGYAAGEASRQYGAGLLAHAGSTVTVRNCIFENNTAQEGAAIDAREATLMMENCVVNNNTNTTTTASVITAQSLTMEHVTVANNAGAAPATMGTSSFSVGNTNGTNSLSLASTGADGAKNFANPTNAAGATLGFDTYLGGYSSFRPLTSSAEAGNDIINKASASTSLTTDITVVNDRDLGGVPDLGAYEADLPKKGRVIYVRPGGSGTGDGLSWGNAMGDINAAVQKGVEYNKSLSEADKYDANKHAQVWVAAGTYVATPKYGSVNCFEILEGVDVYGAFPTKKIGNPGMNDRHPFISTSVYNNYDGIYEPEDYETILKPASTSGNRRVLGQADTYNPINAATGGKYVNVGIGNGNYIYQENDVYEEVGAGNGDYIYSANGGEYISAASEYSNYLRIEESGHYYKNASVADKTVYDINNSNLKRLVYVGSSYGDYNIGTTGWWNKRDYYYTQSGGPYVEFKGAGYYETAADVDGTVGQSVGTILNVPNGSGNLILTEKGYNQVGSGYGNYVFVSKGYHKVEQGQGDYIYTADNRFGIETVWDGFTLTTGYLDSNSLPYLDDKGKRNGGAGAAIFTNVILKNCIVTGNTNTSTNTGQEIRGGGVYCDEGTLVNCYILTNTLGKSGQLTAYGGGVYMYNGTAYNCVISQNQTLGQHTDGAAIFIESGEFFNNTIVSNISNGTIRGNGGICVYYNADDHKQDEITQLDSRLRVYNCISIDNTSSEIGTLVGYDDAAANGGAMDCYNSIFGVIPSNQSGGSASIGFINCDGGTTDNLFANYAEGNYRLKANAIALNKGENIPVVNGVEIDLAEYTDMDFTDRIKDCTIDIGAYELTNTTTTPDVDTQKATATYYVTQNGNGTASASSEENAACAMKLQTVLNAAGQYKQQHPGYQVIVKVAGYKDASFVYHANTLANANDPQSYSYTVPYGVELQGGYSDQDANWDDEGSRDIMTNRTVLSAIKSATTTQQEVNGYHVVTFGEKPEGWTGSDAQTIIDGVWLEDGSATSLAGAGSPNTRGGGAIVPSGAHVRNCVVRNCAATEGGGLYLMPGATVSGTLIMDNSAENGGGVYADATNVSADSRAHILSSTIAGNTASTSGGGLYMEDGAVMNVNTVIFGNTAGSDKNVSGATNTQFADSKLSAVYGITDKTDFYPFNDCFVETQEMPSDFENTRLESDASLYFTGDFYQLKDYSLLIKHGLKNEYQEKETQADPSLVTTFNVAKSDMQNIARVQTGNGAERLDAGAFAYEGGILPKALFTRIFVSQTTNVTLPEGSNMSDYLGRSFYTSFSTLEDALGYIRSMRKNYPDTHFDILVAGGTYKPSNERTTTAAVTHDQRLYSFDVPQNVSIYGGFVGTEKYTSGSVSSVPGMSDTFTNIEGDDKDLTGILNDRTYSDFNQNGINEPWELANQTILSGQINASGAAQNAYHVVFTDKGTATTANPVVLDGLTVMNGETDNQLSISTAEDEQGRGGGIYSNGITYTISRCRLLNNTAVRGGAVFVRDADLNLSGCILAGNKTVENKATDNTLASRGGAAYVSGKSKAVNLRAVNTLWANNESAGEGGAIGTNYAEGVSSSHDPLLYIMNNTFVRNKAITNPVIYTHNGKSSIVNTLLWGNQGGYQDATNLSIISNVSYCASDVDYVNKFASGNANILLSTDNMNDNGPRFTNPSTVAGVAGNSASSLWNPAAISVLTDAGDGTEHNGDQSNSSETDHTPNGTTGAYQNWFSDNGYLGQNGVTEAYITGGTYSRYSGPRGKNNEELCKPIDIGLYEYQYISNFSTMPAIYVATLSAGNGSGSSWANATDDLRGAIVGAANPTDNVDKPRIVYVRDGNYSWNRTSAGSAYILNMNDDDKNKSLTLKGSCTGSGELQDFSKPTVIRNDGATTTLMSVAANTKPVTFEGFTFINNSTTSGEGMKASAGTDGSLTLKNCGFRISPTGLNISGNSGKVLIYNTLFADGGTGLVANGNTTVVNATFAQNATDLTGTPAGIYNSVAWNNGTQNLAKLSNYNNVAITAEFANDDVQNGPNFVDPSNNNKESRDYHIRPSVLLLNKGYNQNYIDHVVKVVSGENATAIPATEVDLGNNARLVDNSIDVGAYEYEAPLQPIVYVKADLTGTADGKSWETALGDLQGAVDLAGLYALNQNATGYVFVHGNYHDTGSLNLSLGNTKVYGGMNDERSDEALAEDFGNTATVVKSLLSKRKGMLEATSRSLLQNVTLGADAVVDGFVVNGTAAVNNGVLSTSVVKNDVSGSGATPGVLYNSLALGSVTGVKAVNVTATSDLINVAKGSGNNRASASENTYVTADYWKYQLMETDADNLDQGTDATTKTYIDKVGHSRDLIGNKRIRNTVDNGCFETWNITEDAQITATDKPVGQSVVYVRQGKELSMAEGVYPEGQNFTPGYLLLEHQSGLRGNGNYISLNNFAVERNVAAGGKDLAGNDLAGNDLAVMPFKVTGVTPDAGYSLKRYNGSTRAAYDFTFDSTNGNAWTDGMAWTDQDFASRGETEGFLIENTSDNDMTIRFSGNSYSEGGADKSVVLMKYNFNDPWTSTTSGGNRFTHKENMSWNLFGSPYLCAMNYGDMAYGRVLYGYTADTYKTVNTANETAGYIPAGDAVFTQTATLRERESVSIALPSSSGRQGDAYASSARLQLTLSPAEATRATADGASAADMLQLNAVPADEARQDFDLGADGVKWMSTAAVPQLYAVRSGNRYSLLSAVSEEGETPLGVTASKAGTYQLGIAGNEGYETVELTDHLTGRTVDLTAAPYTFTLPADTCIDQRFTLRFRTLDDEGADGGIRIRLQDDGSICVSGLEPGQRIQAYSVGGQLEWKHVATESQCVFRLQRGVHVVEVREGGTKRAVSKLMVP